MKLIFMGTPQLVIPILNTLIKHHEVSLVVTQPDRPKGRGQKLEPSPVKVLSQQLNIPILQPTSLKSKDFHEEIKKQNADLIVVVAFSILPSSLFKLTKWGAINLHTSLLPKFRGAAPIQWAIIQGERETGVSVFSLDDKIDHGTILGQKKTQIQENETAQELGERLVNLGQNLLLEVINNMEKNKITYQEQEHIQATSARKLKKDDGIINWNQTSKIIHNQVRGMNPYPIAYSYLQPFQKDISQKKYLKVRIHQTELTTDPSNYPPGVITKDINKFPRVHCIDFQIILKIVQLDGKPKTSGDSFLNGLQNNISTENLHLHLSSQNSAS